MDEGVCDNGKGGWGREGLWGRTTWRGDTFAVLELLLPRIVS
jgi:hypothetical protein